MPLGFSRVNSLSFRVQETNIVGTFDFSDSQQSGHLLTVGIL